MKYDHIVVGGGTAGCIVATRLSEDPDRSVLLLEAGPEYPDFEQLPDSLKYGWGMLNLEARKAGGPFNWSFTGTATPQQPSPMPVPRGKAMGGTSAINGQTFIRGTPEDFDTWAGMGNDGWSYLECLPFFRKLESDEDYSGDFHGNDGPVPVRRHHRETWPPAQEAFYQACIAAGHLDYPDVHEPDSTGVSLRAENNIDGVRMSMALNYLDLARHRLNFNIRGSVTARRILFDGKRAVGIEAESGGEVFTVEGEQIIVCSGAVASPQLLMLSGIGPAEHLQSMGIDVVHDSPGVGQNLRDHPSAAVLYRATGDRPDVQAPVIQVGLRYTVENSNIRNDMQISPMLMTSEHRPAQVEIDDDENYIGLSASLQLALGKGELKLTSTDPHVQPFLNYNYFEEEEDLRRMREAVRLCIQICEQTSFNSILLDLVNPTERDLVSDETLNAWLMRNTGTSHHISGTCKMGPDSDAMAVVDQYCHVRGVEGLRVADASVMPNCIRANTNATTIMIGEKVADWIKEGR